MVYSTLLIEDHELAEANRERPSGKEISVRELIGLYDSLGIPHFQRGLVWADENTALLLESLYFNTPCGSIILWEPNNPDKEGIPLPGRPSALPAAASPKPKYLIVDGQQRIRSLQNALGCFVDYGREGNGGQVWCLNLTHVPELADFFRDDSALRYSMFCLISDPTKEEPRRRYNLVPLKTFFGRDEADISTFIKSARSEEVLPKVAKIDLGQRIKSLLDKNVFFLKFLTEQPQHNHASGESHEEYHLPQVVALYNRINSAGKRVEAEEKIFATLVSFQPAANQWLSDLFKSVHDPDPGVQERDDILKRRKERNFGFKLFIRAFVQVCAYHFGKPLGNGSFSFGVVNSPLFQEKLLKDGELNPLFERTTKVVKFVRDLLQDGLYCDDLQTLPETTPLLPLFEVLIRFPKLLDAQPRDAKALQCLALRLLLSRDLDIAAGKNRLTDEDILRLVKSVDEAKTASECIRRLDAGIGGTVDDLGSPQFSARLKAANTLLDRYVSMLYWVLRKKGARDFSYKNLEVHPSKLKPGTGPLLEPGAEIVLNEDAAPERQHILPYSLLAIVYNIQGQRARVSRHEVNNIGNITFISQKLNSFDTGLGSEPIKLNLEDPPENLDHHFLGKAAGETYNHATQVATELADKINSKAQVTAAERKNAQDLFQNFCDERRDLIQEAFAEWVDEFGPPTVVEEIAPAERQFVARPQNAVRAGGTLPTHDWPGFWGGFNDYCRKHALPLDLPLKEGPRKEGSYWWILGRRDVALGFVFYTRGELCCKISIAPNARRQFRKLREDTKQIEDELKLGSANVLKWEEPAGESQWANVTESRHASLKTMDDWPELYRWMRDRACAFHDVFGRRVQAVFP